MERQPREGTDPLEPIRVKVRWHYHFGLALLLAGVVILAACFGLERFLGGFASTISEGFLLYVIGSAGFALILAGAVFFQESRAFLRRNKPDA